MTASATCASELTSRDLVSDWGAISSFIFGRRARHRTLVGFLRANGSYKFRQSTDFFYLTGFDEPEACAILGESRDDPS